VPAWPDSLRSEPMDLGPHSAFIVTAYGAAALVLAGLVAWLVIDGQRLQRLVDRLEARGVRRRSDPSQSR
jgi:heme exporter protein D